MTDTERLQQIKSHIPLLQLPYDRETIEWLVEQLEAERKAHAITHEILSGLNAGRHDDIQLLEWWKKHAQESDHEFLQMSDWLIGNAEFDLKTGLIDHAAKLKERIRDLIAVEAEAVELREKLEVALTANKNANAAIGDIANECKSYCTRFDAEREKVKKLRAAVTRWMDERRAKGYLMRDETEAAVIKVMAETEDK